MPRQPAPKSGTIPSFPKQSLEPAHLNEIAELSELYVGIEFGEFTEETLLSSLSALYLISKEQGRRMKKEHRERIEELVISAQAVTNQQQTSQLDIKTQQSVSILTQHQQSGFISQNESKRYFEAISWLAQGLKNVDLKAYASVMKGYFVDKTGKSVPKGTKDAIALYAYLSKAKKNLTDRLDEIASTNDISKYNSFASDYAAQNTMFYLLCLPQNFALIESSFKEEKKKEEQPAAPEQQNYFYEKDPYAKQDNTTSPVRVPEKVELLTPENPRYQGIRKQFIDRAKAAVTTALLTSNPSEWNQGLFYKNCTNAPKFCEYMFDMVANLKIAYESISDGLKNSSGSGLVDVLYGIFSLKCTPSQQVSSAIVDLSEAQAKAVYYLLKAFDIGVKTIEANMLLVVPSKKTVTFDEMLVEIKKDSKKPKLNTEKAYALSFSHQQLLLHAIYPGSKNNEWKTKLDGEWDKVKDLDISTFQGKAACFKSYLNMLGHAQEAFTDFNDRMQRIGTGTNWNIYDVKYGASNVSLAVDAILSVASFIPVVGGFALLGLIGIGATDEALMIADEVKKGAGTGKVIMEHLGSMAFYSYMALAVFHVKLPGVLKTGADIYFASSLSLSVINSTISLSSIDDDVKAGRITENEAKLLKNQSWGSLITSMTFLGHMGLPKGKMSTNKSEEKSIIINDVTYTDADLPALLNKIRTEMENKDYNNPIKLKNGESVICYNDGKTAFSLFPQLVKLEDGRVVTAREAMERKVYEKLLKSETIEEFANNLNDLNNGIYPLQAQEPVKKTEPEKKPKKMEKVKPKAPIFFMASMPAAKLANTDRVIPKPDKIETIVETKPDIDKFIEELNEKYDWKSKLKSIDYGERDLKEQIEKLLNTYLKAPKTGHDSNPLIYLPSVFPKENFKGYGNGYARILVSGTGEYVIQLDMRDPKNPVIFGFEKHTPEKHDKFCNMTKSQFNRAMVNMNKNKKMNLIEMPTYDEVTITKPNMEMLPGVSPEFKARVVILDTDYLIRLMESGDDVGAILKSLKNQCKENGSVIIPAQVLNTLENLTKIKYDSDGIRPGEIIVSPDKLELLNKIIKEINLQVEPMGKDENGFDEKTPDAGINSLLKAMGRLWTEEGYEVVVVSNKESVAKTVESTIKNKENESIKLIRVQ